MFLSRWRHHRRYSHHNPFHNCLVDLPRSHHTPKLPRTTDALPTADTPPCPRDTPPRRVHIRRSPSGCIYRRSSVVFDLCEYDDDQWSVSSSVRQERLRHSRHPVHLRWPLRDYVRPQRSTGHTAALRTTDHRGDGRRNYYDD